MKVYHGSYTVIDKIDLSKAMANRDFGRGFYVTKFRHHAEAWAKNIGRNHKTEGVVSEFEYSDNGFIRDICKIKQFDDYNEEWLDFVVMNRDRDNPDPAHDYDIVEGPVADDKIQNTLRLYLKGKIPRDKFLKMLSMHEETHQICFCTLNSLQCIERIDDTPTFDMVMISEPVIEKLMLDHDMDDRTASDKFFSSATFARLSDESTGLYQKPWTEIYEMLKSELTQE
jgi:hypothetical protein